MYFPVGLLIDKALGPILPDGKESSMKWVLPVLMTGMLGVEASPAWANYAAIAFSPKTRVYGSANNCKTLLQAKKLALKNCKADDATVVGWARNGYAALAVGDKAGVYSWSWGKTQHEAEALALRWCSQHTTNCYILVAVHSGR
jgi:hypothetical protein